MIIPSLHHAGLASFIIIVVSLGTMLKLWGGDRTRSLSNHGANHKQSYFLFMTALVVAGLLFCGFFLWWLAPTLGLAPWCDVVVLCTVICELVAAFVPDNGGRNSLIHKIGAWTMAVGMLVLSILLYKAPHITHAAQVVLVVLIGYMLINWCLFLFVRPSRRYFLIFQSAYVLSFYATVLATTYIR